MFQRYLSQFPRAHGFSIRWSHKINVSLKCNSLYNSPPQKQRGSLRNYCRRGGRRLSVAESSLQRTALLPPPSAVCCSPLPNGKLLVHTAVLVALYQVLVLLNHCWEHLQIKLWIAIVYTYTISVIATSSSKIH